jgi:hypothetical protein
MPERDAVTCTMGDGYLLIAAGLRREKSGELTGDLMLQNGRILYADRAVLNTAEGRRAWAQAAETTDGPTPARMQNALLEHVLPDALAILQEDPKKPTQADQLVGMVSELVEDFTGDVAEAVELFHDPGGIAYATIPIDDHRETWLLHSKGFRQWLARRYHEQHGKTPNAQALVDATNVLAGKATFDGPEHRVHLRLAEHEGVTYLDLGNASWNAIAIDRTGWRVVTTPPVKFRRTRGMLPLPAPTAGGNLAALRGFVNLPTRVAGDDGDDAAWILLVAWLIAGFRARGPYPVLVALGEQGSAKSTLLRVLRSLFDPNKAPIRSLPRDERDLMIAGTNGWCLAFDNLSHVQDWQSDALCRISTGGGFAARELYSDQDETILDVQRPVALNGIEEVVSRNDLLDRSIMLYLPTISPECRQPEKRFWHEFEQARPAILGAILNAVSTALANEATVTLDGHPRMADFAEWIVAAEPALPWKAGAFLSAYLGNQKDANDLTLEASPVAHALRDFMGTRPEPWVGTATDLLAELDGMTSEQVRRQKSWPGSGRTLSNALRRLAPNLRAVGVDVTFDERKHGGRRIIRIEQHTHSEHQGNSASPASPSAPSASPRRDSGDDETDGDAIHRHPDIPSSPDWNQDFLEWRGNPGCDDDGDGGDDEIPSCSEWAEEEIV